MNVIKKMINTDNSINLINWIVKRVLNQSIDFVELEYFKEDYDIELTKVLKKKGFVENLIDVQGSKQIAFIRGFVCVVMMEDKVFISHYGAPIKKGMKLTEVENHIYTLNSWIKYFDKI